MPWARASSTEMAPLLSVSKHWKIDCSSSSSCGLDILVWGGGVLLRLRPDAAVHNVAWNELTLTDLATIIYFECNRGN